MSSLSLFFLVGAGLSVLGVVASMFWGLAMMTRGRESDHIKSNRMMRFRVICQGLTLLFLLLAFGAR